MVWLVDVFMTLIVLNFILLLLKESEFIIRNSHLHLMKSWANFLAVGVIIISVEGTDYFNIAFPYPELLCPCLHIRFLYLNFFDI